MTNNPPTYNLVYIKTINHIETHNDRENGKTGSTYLNSFTQILFFKLQKEKTNQKSGPERANHIDDAEAIIYPRTSIETGTIYAQG